MIIVHDLDYGWMLIKILNEYRNHEPKKVMVIVYSIKRIIHYFFLKREDNSSILLPRDAYITSHYIFIRYFTNQYSFRHLR